MLVGPPTSEHTRCRERPLPTQEHEPTYQSDLQTLIALASARMKAASPVETDALDAPLSLGEATRLTEALLPAPPARRRRLRVAALPLLALAGAGAVVQISQLAGQRRSRPPPAIPATLPPALVETIAAPIATTSMAVAEPEPYRIPEPSVHPKTPASPVQPLPARPQPAIVLRSPTADVRASTSTPTASVTAAPEPPSLMQAITDAVRSSRPPTNRR